METDNANEHRSPAKQLVVGLDPGTTFSGLSWQQHHQRSRRVNDVEARTVRAWPSSHGPDQDESKVPSRLVYDAQGNVKAWGYDVTRGGNGITMEWFKLAIVPDKDLPSHLQNSAKLKETKKNMRDLGINAGQVMAQYMEKIWAHAQGEIRKNVGPESFKAMPVHVVITIPAIWGNEAIQVMKDAAAFSILRSETAGLTTYEFLSEPEAAVQAYAKELQLKLDVGDTVMVVDLGGGTGDIISYQKTGEGSEDYLELKEAALGDGDLCGAIFVDEAFENLLLDRLPAQHRNIKTKSPGAWRKLLSEQWQQSIKRSFKWEGTERLWPVILSNIAPTVDVVNLHEDEIRDVFENSVMPKIIELIKRQIEEIKKVHGGKAPRVILPVGGFGRCPYVLQRLREVFEGVSVTSKRTKRGGKKKQKLDYHGIEIHSETGEMPWTAVCRGACQFGMRAQLNNRLVKSRLSRISVGFCQIEPGSKEEGGEYKPGFDTYMIPDHMRWVVKKGDVISADKKSTMAMFLAFDRDAKGMHTQHSPFYAHRGVDPPPKRFGDAEAELQEYGVMTITITNPIEQLKLEDSGDGGIRAFDYNLQIEIVGGSVQITGTSAVRGDGGKEVGKLVLPKLETM